MRRALALCFPIEAQQPTKVPRIEVLASPSAAFFLTRLNAFREGLRDLGYVESKNIAIEYRFAEGKEERFPTAKQIGLTIPRNVLARADRVIK